MKIFRVPVVFVISTSSSPSSSPSSRTTEGFFFFFVDRTQTHTLLTACYEKTVYCLGGIKSTAPPDVNHTNLYRNGGFEEKRLLDIPYEQAEIMILFYETATWVVSPWSTTHWRPLLRRVNRFRSLVAFLWFNMAKTFLLLSIVSCFIYLFFIII